jgi:hypothetical protein
LRFAGPDRIPGLLDRIRAASVAADRPADAVRAVYSVPVRLDPKAGTTPGVIAGSATGIIDQLHSFTGLGLTGCDLLPSQNQMRAVAEDVVPALRDLPLSGTHRELKRLRIPPAPQHRYRLGAMTAKLHLWPVPKRPAADHCRRGLGARAAGGLSADGACGP